MTTMDEALPVPLFAGDELPENVPLTFGELAAYARRKGAKMSTKRMRRLCIRLHKRCGDLLIRNVSESGDSRGDRYMVVSRASLQRFWPHFGRKTATAEDLDRAVKAAVGTIRKDVRALQKRTREIEGFQQLSLGWFERALKRPKETTPNTA